MPEKKVKIKTLKKVTDSVQENVIEWLSENDGTAALTLAKSPLSQKLKKQAEKRPDEITNLVANRDGSIFCHVPLEWISINIPRAKKSEKQKAAEFKKRDKK